VKLGATQRSQSSPIPVNLTCDRLWVSVAGKFPAILITVFRLKLLSVTLDGEMLLPKIGIANS
jgi:hypothetical protein